MMKLLLMIRRSKNYLLYIFKKSEIIKATAFVLVFVLVAGLNPLLSKEMVVYGNVASEKAINKEAIFYAVEGLKPISINTLGIFIPVLVLADYLDANSVKLRDLYRGAVSEEEAVVTTETTRDADNDIVALKGYKTTGSSEITGKTAYLTFDDGLDKKVTPQILDILKRYDIKATFFILGNSVDKNMDVLKRLVDEGHIVGNHTYTHKKSIIYTDVKKFSEELTRTSKAIFDAVGVRTKLFRPPYGAPYIRSKEYKDALSGYKIVLWNVDSMDSRIKGITSSEIVETVKNQVKNKRNAIILFHSTSARTETVKALPEIIEYLIDNGYNISLLE